MIATTLITYALVLNNINLLGSIEFNTLEDCQVHLISEMYDEKYFDMARCVRIETVETVEY
jgi:hypothetical protein